MEPPILSVLTIEDEDEDLIPSIGPSATPGSSASRARMLAQQRDIQLKKRQSSLQGGGMVRSSREAVAGASPLKPTSEQQFTGAVRQFSAPKAVNVNVE